ncbi:hypothetical protein VKT23_011897 [Stygiomarasmius scandens]|uniref:Mid2 domain-containing protein n=1 Tax=Marasmiellus scandens TaxID=2682957 RepID=A0ABR1JBA3_9AGAR
MALHCWPFVLLQISLVWGLKLTISSSTVTIGQPASVTWTLDPQDQKKTFAIVPVFDGISINPSGFSDWQQFLVSPQGKETNTFSTPITTPGTFHFEAYSIPLPIKRRNVINRRFFGVELLAKSDSITAVQSSASAGTPSKSPTATSSSLSDTVVSSTPSDSSSSVIIQASFLADGSGSITVPATAVHSQSSAPPSTSTSKSDVSVTGPPSQQLATATTTMTSSASITVTPESRSGSISNKNKLLAIILASIFGALILSIAITLIVLWIRRRNKNRGGTTLVSSIPGNPCYSKSDSWVSVSEKRFSEYSASDCDSTSIAPSDSISQVLHYTQTSAKRNPFVPSTTLATVPEGENAVVTDTNINNGPES